MARIIYSGLVTSIRGSIGGTTFQSNAYGFSVKNKPNMIKPNSVSQNRQKVYFSQAVKLWGELTPANRAAWDNWAATYPQFAKHNTGSVLTGFNVFVARAVIWPLVYEGVVYPYATPEFVVYPIDVPTITFQWTDGILTFNVNWLIGDDSLDVVWFLSAPLSNGRNYVNSLEKFYIGYINLDSPYNLSSLYFEKFGMSLNVGDRISIAYDLYARSNGQRFATVRNIYTIPDE